jgi:hypothetical protein
VDVALKYLPVPVVDACREFARILLAAWLPTIGKRAQGDLASLINMTPSDYIMVKSAASIINRMHPRGKSSEHQTQRGKGRELWEITLEDSEISVGLIALLLREFGWVS